MAVQLNYVAAKDWKPSKEYLITLIKVELSETAIKEAKGKSLKKIFEDAAASVAAESSTGTWTKVYDGEGSGMSRAAKERAMAFDLDYTNHMFKVAYPPFLFELDNISGLFAGIIGNIAGMKMVSAMRVYDVKFPEKMIKAFPGPRFGVKGIRKLLKKPRGPLVATVPKPKIGRTAKEQADLAKMLFTSGLGTYDGIKDDEKQTGKKKFYLCNVSHSNLEVMRKRAKLIKDNGGIFMMLDVVCTGFAAADTMRRYNPGLAIHAHRAMHGFITRDNSPGVHGHGKLYGFSVSMIFLAKTFRLLGVDTLHGGSPLAKMEDYGEAKYIQQVLQEKNLKPHPKIPSLGQDWYHIKPVWMVASGGLHPGDFELILKELGEDIIIQCGGGLLGHPDGVEAGVIAIEQARELAMKKIPLKKWVEQHPHSELAAAVNLWGYGPRIVY